MSTRKMPLPPGLRYLFSSVPKRPLRPRPARGGSQVLSPRVQLVWYKLTVSVHRRSAEAPASAGASASGNHAPIVPLGVRPLMAKGARQTL